MLKRFGAVGAAASWLALGILGCAGSSAGPGTDSSASRPAAKNDTDNPLFVSPTSYDFAKNPKLLERILAGPHGYFRFINRQFATETCRRFEKTVDHVPVVNLHGDAHVEQYAVTDLGRGLTDFDDATSGPAVIDLVRFGVSLRLASEARGWTSKDADHLFGRFLDGYRAALEKPDAVPPEPKLAAQVRTEFKKDRAAYFKWIEKVMAPVPEQTRARLQASFAPYVKTMCAGDPALAPGYFEIRDLGRLNMGIGSALDLKYLVRVAGPTDDPLDDVILEVKEVRDLAGVSCVSHQDKGDAFRVLVGQSRIAYEPYRLLGYLRLEGRVFWIHAWVDNYRELNVDKDDAVGSLEEVAEIVYDVGVQLGRGHPAQIAAPLDLQLRMAQLRMLDESQDTIVRATRKLAADTVQAWQRFKTEVEANPAATSP